MTQADRVHSTPRTTAPPPSTDDDLGMAWWNALTEKDRRLWMRLAGDTGRAVDAWRAFKGVRLSSERELDPRDVLTELFREEMIPDADLLADLVIARLGSKGFKIVPIDYPKGGAA